MHLKFFILALIIGLWPLPSTGLEPRWAEYPADNSSTSLQNNTHIYPENRIIKKGLEVTPRWQTITFNKPLQINRKGLMGLHVAVDKKLYIPAIYDQTRNRKKNEPDCGPNAFCLRRVKDDSLIWPEAFLIGDNGVEIKIKPSGHLYPNFDKNVITIALRTFKGANSVPPRFPKGIKAFKALRIRSAESFRIQYFFWNVDRYPFYK